MIELRDRAGFAVEAVPELRVGSQSLGKNLDCDGAIQTGVARFVHLAHPASADQRENLVRAETRADGNEHGSTPILATEPFTAKEKGTPAQPAIRRFRSGCQQISAHPSERKASWIS